MRRISGLSFALIVFTLILCIQAYSVFGQSSEIVGTWNNGSVGAISYQNEVTGSIKPGRGSVFSYRFHPNGNFEYIGYMEVTMYNCTNTLFNNLTGKYSVDGSTITLVPNKDFWKSTNTCAKSGNKQQTKPPVKRTMQFEVRDDEYGRKQLCVDEGKGESCYRKEEN